MALYNGDSWSYSNLKRVRRRNGCEDDSRADDVANEYVFANEMKCFEPSAFLRGTNLHLLHLQVHQQLSG